MGILTGKCAIVTGGGGHIGRGICRAFAKEGARIAVADRHLAAATLAVKDIEDAGGQGFAIACNLALETDCRSLIAATVARFGQLDILVNAAQSWTGGSKSHRGAPLESLPEEWWDECFDTGVKATWRCSRFAFPHMKNRGGKIINFASVMGIVGWAKAIDYNSNKEAIRAFTRTAAKEWGKFKVNVNTICPSAMTVENVLGSSDVSAEEAIKRSIASRPIARVGDPEKDIGRVAVFLASEDSDYITGQTFMVDGGSHML